MGAHVRVTDSGRAANDRTPLNKATIGTYLRDVFRDRLGIVVQKSGLGARTSDLLGNLQVDLGVDRDLATPAFDTDIQRRTVAERRPDVAGDRAAIQEDGFFANDVVHQQLDI